MRLANNFFLNALKGAFFFIIFLFIFLIFPITPVCGAFSFNLTEINPSSVSSKDQEVNVSISINGLPSESYFRVAWKKGDDSGSYFGYVKDNSGQWQKIEALSSSNCAKYYKVTQTGDSQITLVTKIGEEENVESGNYLIRAHRFTSTSCSETASNNSLPIQVQLVSSLPSSPSSPSPSPLSSSPSSATYKIGDVKDKNGAVLSSIKIYIDGTYTGHYAPETFSFCDGCNDGGFGQHTIRLEKSGYEDWSETREITAGSLYEVNPQMNQASANPSLSPSLTPSSSTPVSPKASTQIISATALKKVSPSPSPSPSVETLISPLPSATVSPSPQILGEETGFNKKLLIPLGFMGAGSLLLAVAFGPALLKQAKERWYTRKI